MTKAETKKRVGPTPYVERVAQEGEALKWQDKEFLRRDNPERPFSFDMESIFMPEIHSSSYISQVNPSNFSEFDTDRVQEVTGVTGSSMRECGCGACSLQMINLALNQDEAVFPTVGSLAIAALSLNRVARKDAEGNWIRGSGTPVFNTNVGWFHDGLLGTAREYLGTEVFRREGLSSLEQVALDAVKLQEEGKTFLIVISVDNLYWRKIGNEPESREGHLVIINGFAFRNGKLDKIRVVDSFYKDGLPKINKWIEVDETVRNAFAPPDEGRQLRGRKAMFFIKK